MRAGSAMRTPAATRSPRVRPGAGGPGTGTVVLPGARDSSALIPGTLAAEPGRTLGKVPACQRSPRLPTCPRSAHRIAEPGAGCGQHRAIPVGGTSDREDPRVVADDLHGALRAGA